MLNMVLRRRRYAARRVASSVSHGFRILFLAWFSVLSRRRLFQRRIFGLPVLMFEKWDLESASRRYAL
jgi:hypothetical protein